MFGLRYKSHLSLPFGFLLEYFAVIYLVFAKISKNLLVKEV